MSPKVLIGVLFLITFVISFIIYLIVIGFLGSHIDLSSTAKKDLEVSPNITESTFKRRPINNNISDLQQRAMQNAETYQQDLQGVTPVNEVSNTSTNSTTDNTNNYNTTDEDIRSEQIQSVTTTREQKPPINEPTINININTNTINRPRPSSNVKIEKFTPDKQQQQQFTPTLDTKETKSVSRVYVGEYNSPEEAKKASDNMMNSNPNVAPIIKQNRGKYSLQVGAFSDKAKADNLVKTLNTQKYSATVKSE